MVARDLQAGTPARSREGGGTRAGRQLEVVSRGRQNGWPNDGQVRIRSYSHYWLSANSLANTGTVSPHKILFALLVIGELSGEYWHGEQLSETADSLQEI